MAPRDGTELDWQVDRVMDASRAFVAIATVSLAEQDVSITLPQWRVLAIVNRHGPLTPGAVAHWMGVHPSTATRTCDGLVRSDLLFRREDPTDRRRQVLTLSERGRALVDSVLSRRREAVASVLRQIPAAHRGRLAEAMQEFAEAVEDAPEQW